MMANDVDEWGQPTVEALQSAWTNAISSEDIGGARAETREELKRLRSLKTTWYRDEYKLAMAIDSYLRETQ